MRITVEIDPKLLADAMQLSESKTKKDLIHRSLTELVRRYRIKELKAMMGTMDLDVYEETVKRVSVDD